VTAGPARTDRGLRDRGPITLQQLVLIAQIR
jgi:hypothetical protein